MPSNLRRTAVCIALVLFAGACGDSTTTSSMTTMTRPAVTTRGDEIVVATYFSRQGLLVAGSRSVTKAGSLRAAVAAVIDGPNPAERAAGFGSAIPTGTSLRGVTLEGRRANVDLTNAFTSGGGSLSMRLRVAQLVYTVVRSGAADSVRVLIDGQRVESIGGEGFIVTDVKPAEFDDLLPPIVIEFPTPGATVTSGFAFRGLANVFEGNVSYELVDSKASRVANGFATGMMGSWGEFSTVVTFASVPSGPLELVVFWESPKDGSRRDESRTSLVHS